MPGKKPVFNWLLAVLLVLAALVQPVSAQQIDQTYTCADVTGIPLAECQALQALFDSTDGPNWANTSDQWFESTDPTTWYGITLFDGHIQAIDLLANNLTGSIPGELGSLTELYRLSLYDNLLTGTIPASLGSLTKLEFLDLGRNQLSGSIPVELGNLAMLDTLSLEFNDLSGSIPAQLGNLTLLIQILAGHNQLSGGIPAELGNLVNLQVLWLNNNSLGGYIPNNLANLVSLKDPGAVLGGDGLDLDYNSLLVPWNYPSPAEPLHALLSQKDPNWHLRQNSDPLKLVFMPIILR